MALSSRENAAGENPSVFFQVRHTESVRSKSHGDKLGRSRIFIDVVTRSLSLESVWLGLKWDRFVVHDVRKRRARSNLLSQSNKERNLDVNKALG